MPIVGTEIRAHLWDFGGQVIFHATHQFFLRSRCLYIVVLDGRNDFSPNEQAQYWLEHVKAFGSGSPVMLVGNKADEVPVDIDLRALREKFPNVRNFYSLSCTEVRSRFAVEFALFNRDLIAQISRIDTNQMMFTDKEFAAVEELRVRSRASAFLGHSDYEDVCRKYAIATGRENRSDQLLDLLDKLGIVLQFPSLPRMKDYLLNPRWLTYGVYRILSSEQALRRQGRLSESDCSQILNSDPIVDNQGNILSYPADRCEFIVDAMEQFKICYRLPHNRQELVIPALLPSKQPETRIRSK